MFARVNWAQTFASNLSPTTGVPVDAVLTTAGLNNSATAEQVTDYFVSLLIQAPLAPAIRQSLVDYLKRRDDGALGDFSIDVDRANRFRKVRGLIRLLVSRPEFQNW
jgi:hypothetical protein